VDKLLLVLASAVIYISETVWVRGNILRFQKPGYRAYVLPHNILLATSSTDRTDDIMLRNALHSALNP
jgi:hypothetical protein